MQWCSHHVLNKHPPLPSVQPSHASHGQSLKADVRRGSWSCHPFSATDGRCSVLAVTPPPHDLTVVRRVLCAACKKPSRASSPLHGLSYCLWRWGPSQALWIGGCPASDSHPPPPWLLLALQAHWHQARICPAWGCAHGPRWPMSVEWLEFWVEVGLGSKRQETQQDRTMGSSSFSRGYRAVSS